MNLRELSRAQVKSTNGGSTEAVNAGSLQRIADSLESIEKMMKEDRVVKYKTPGPTPTEKELLSSLSPEDVRCADLLSSVAAMILGKIK